MAERTTQLNSEMMRIAPNDTSPHWYAVYTSARHEKRVAEQLDRKSVECFLPLYETVRRWKDRRAHVSLPLFPGYVFVHLPYRDRLVVLEVPGVVRFVTFQGKPAPLPEFEIETLRSGLRERRAQPHPYLTVGRRVRITSGPFVGMEGILKRRKENLRLVLSLDLLMRSVLLEIDQSEIEPLLQQK